MGVQAHIQKSCGKPSSFHSSGKVICSSGKGICIYLVCNKCSLSAAPVLDQPWGTVLPLGILTEGSIWKKVCAKVCAVWQLTRGCPECSHMNGTMSSVMYFGLHKTSGGRVFSSKVFCSLLLARDRQPPHSCTPCLRNMPQTLGWLSSLGLSCLGSSAGFGLKSCPSPPANDYTCIINYFSSLSVGSHVEILSQSVPNECDTFWKISHENQSLALATEHEHVLPTGPVSAAFSAEPKPEVWSGSKSHVAFKHEGYKASGIPQYSNQTLQALGHQTSHSDSQQGKQ